MQLHDLERSWSHWGCAWSEPSNMRLILHLRVLYQEPYINY